MMQAWRSIARVGVALLCASAPAIAVGQALPELPKQPPELPPAPFEVEAGSPYVIYPVRGGVYMISGPAGNIAVQAGLDGIVLVDSGEAKSTDGLLKEIRRISRKPILYILNTNGDDDHVGGNAVLSTKGIALAGSVNLRPETLGGGTGVSIFAHEGVMNRLVGEGHTEGLPTLTYFVEQKDMFFNGEPVSLLHAPGHTDGDSFVMFRRSDVVAAGDIYTPDRYPDIDIENGGSIRNELDSLNYLLRLTIPEFNEEGGTFVIPGHGRLSDEGDVGDYRDMVTFIVERIQSMMDKQMTLEQIKAARPTQDYDPLYGPEAGDVFVEQVYRSLASDGAAG